MRALADLLPGTLDLLVLKAVSLGHCMATASCCASSRSRSECCKSSKVRFILLCIV